jgi:hypothetical protein
VIEAKYKKQFESNYGEGTWEPFCHFVYDEVRSMVIRSRFTSQRSGKGMNRASFSLWKSHANEVRPSERV